MPTLLDVSVVQLEFADLTNRQPIRRPEKPLTRHPGIHQSGVLKYIAERTGKLRSGEPLEEEMPSLIALGYAWEEFAVSLYPDILWQPGERTVDGVSMNCDGVSVLESCARCNKLGFVENDNEDNLAPFKTCPLCKGLCGAIQVEEFKLTFKGVASGEDFLKDDKFWMWRAQGAGYCYGYGAQVERWHVCHIRGDYKKDPATGKAPPWGPVYKTYTLRFSEQELKQNWKMVQNYKEKAAHE